MFNHTMKELCLAIKTYMLSKQNIGVLNAKHRCFEKQSYLLRIYPIKNAF